MRSLLHELMRLFHERRKYWLMPIVFILIFMGAFLVYTANSALTPFLYPFI